MIIRNNKTTSALYKGTKEIVKRYKGTLIVYEAWEELTKSGVPPITLQKCKGVNLVDYKIYGESVQNGTPTPDTPIEIESVGDKTSNLFDKEYLSKTENYTINSGNGYFSAIIKVKPNTTYTVFSKRTEATDTPEKGFYCKVALPTDTVGSVSSFVYYIEASDKFATNNKKTVTTGDDGLIYFAVSGNGSQSMLDVLFKYYYFQIVEGTTELEYEPYGYKIPVKARGINLIDEKTLQTGYIGTTGNVMGNHAQGEKITDYIEIDNTKTYSIKQYTDYATPYIMTALYDKDKNFISNTRKTANKTFLLLDNIDSNAKYIKISARALEYDNNFIQFAEGNYTIDTMPDYEQYQEPVTTNIYLNEPLRKIGDYADYIDFENGKVVRNIKEDQINNSSSLSKFGGVTDYSTFFMRKNDLLDYGEEYKYNPPVLSNTFEFYACGIANNNSSWTRNYQIGASVTSSYKRMCFTLPNTITDVASAKEWLTENPIDYFYITLEPDDTEIIELPNIPTFKGTTIIEVDTSILPSNMEVKYYGKE